METINVGTAANDGTGDSLRAAMQKVNSNFQEASAHSSNQSNPHNVTKTQVGLGDVDNTSDANKPVSDATQLALGSKLSLNQILDEDNFASNSDTLPPSQQSVRVYADAVVGVGTTSGTNSYTVNVGSPKTILTSGYLYAIKWAAASTGAVTLDIQSSGAKKVFKDPTTQAGNGDLVQDSVSLMMYQSNLDGGTGGYLIIGSVGSPSVADFISLSDAAPVVFNCQNLPEPKGYLETSSSRTFDLQNVRGDNDALKYSIITKIIKKTTAGDITITLDSYFTNRDFASDAAAPSYTLSGDNNAYFKLTGLVMGQGSGAIIWWSLAAVASGGGGGSVESVTGPYVVNTDPANPVVGTGDGLQAMSESTGVVTLDFDGKPHGRFNTASAASADFELALANTTNAVRFNYFRAITGTVKITLPSDFRMDQDEIDITGRYDDDDSGDRTLTLVGTTATPFEFSGEYNGSVWLFRASNGYV